MATNSRSINSVTNAFRIVSILQSHPQASLAEIATAAGLSKGTVHTYLATMIKEGYVDKTSFGAYELNLEFLRLGDRIRRQQEIYDLGKAKADELAQETGDVTHLAIETNGVIRMLYSARGNPHSFKGATPVGEELPAHASAMGKAIVAHLPTDQIESIVTRRGLYQLTPNTITDSSQFFDELSIIRERGYASNKGEQTVGAHSIATSVRRPDGSIAGAIAISGTLSHFEQKGRETLIKNLLQAANQIEVNIQIKSESQQQAQNK